MNTSTTKPGDKAADHKSAGHTKSDDKSHSGTQHKAADNNKQSAGTTKK